VQALSIPVYASGAAGHRDFASQQQEHQQQQERDGDLHQQQSQQQQIKCRMQNDECRTRSGRNRGEIRARRGGKRSLALPRGVRAATPT
jgi:hypothetical protein